MMFVSSPQKKKKIHKKCTKCTWIDFNTRYKSNASIKICVNKHAKNKNHKQSKQNRNINYPITHHQGNCMHRQHSSLLDCIQRWRIKWSWHDAYHHRLVMPTINYPRDKLCTPTERSDPWNGYTKEKVFLSICYAKIDKKKHKRQIKQILFIHI